MSKTAEQIRKMKKDDVVDYAISISEAYESLKQTFVKKLEHIESVVEVQRAANDVLHEQIAILNKCVELTERVSLNNSHYLRRRQLEIWNLPAATTDKPDIKTEAAKLLPCTSVEIKPDDIDVCHKLKTLGCIIIELHKRTDRYSVVCARKNVKSKKVKLEKENCAKMSVTESMCPEYKRLDFVCRMLKKHGKIQKTWFSNRKLIIVDNFENQKTVSHINDLYNDFGIEAFDGKLTKNKS